MKAFCSKLELFAVASGRAGCGQKGQRAASKAAPPGGVLSRQGRVAMEDHILVCSAFGLEAIASRLEAIASRLEAIASRLEAIASRLEAIASRLEDITSRLEDIASN